MVNTFLSSYLKASFYVNSPSKHDKEQGRSVLQTKAKSIIFPLSCDLRALRINSVFW